MKRISRPPSKRWLNLFVLVNLFILLGIVSVQTASTAIAAPGSQASSQVDVDLDEWELIPEDLTFQAGETVTFNISNIGRFPHAIEVSNSAMHLHSPTIGADETTTLEVTFDYGGEYTFLCPIPGHADLGMVGTLTVEGGDPPPDEGYLGIPLMRLSPRSGTAVDGDSQEVSVTLHDFTLAPDDIGSSQNTPGEGHWDLFLDDQLVESVGTPAFMLEDLAPGQHTIRAALRNNDGTPLDPPVEASTTIQVAQQVDMALNEWNLIPEDFTFQAGERVVFNLTNTGDFPHALEVSNSAIHLHSPTIRADEMTTLAVTFDYGGEYTFLCPIPGHADLGMVGTLTVEGGDPPPDEGYLGIPLMRVRPGSGTEVEGRSQEVGVIIHDFTLAPDDIGSSENTPGEGHWALFLNDTLVASVGMPTFMLENLPSGAHTIRVELRNNDGTPLDPPVEASTTIRVPRFFAVPPNVGDVTPSQWALAGLTTLGVLLMASGGMLLSRRRR